MSDVAEQSALYQKSYSSWAGDPKGRATDYSRCCMSVYDRQRFGRFFQCQNKRGFGPDRAYCKTHDPQTVKAREDAAIRRYAEKYNQDRYKWHGKTFFDALVKIADGHNDARGLAQEVVAAFKAGEQ